MKETELNNAVNSGKIVCVGRYWSGRVEGIEIRDKANPNGPRKHYNIARETILGEADPITVTRFLKDNEDPGTWKPAAKKMDRVVVVLSGMKVDKGTIALNGTVEPLV